jgi:pimeloyl-[acyl-carrier protein] methyl ester esterase
MISAAELPPAIRNPKRQNDIRDVVLLHGWGSSASIWSEFASRFAPDYRAHALDLPGYGAQPRCEPYALDAIVSALARAAPTRCHLVGWSLGGLIALAWARWVPHQVGRLVLIACTPCFAKRRGWRHGVARERARSFCEALARDGTAALRRFALLQARGDRRERPVARRLAAAFEGEARPDAQTLAASLRLLLETDLRGELGALRQPALVVHGQRDQVVPPAAGRYLGCRLRAARCLALREASHAPFLSEPAQVATAVRAFLDE